MVHHSICITFLLRMWLWKQMWLYWQLKNNINVHRGGENFMPENRGCGGFGFGGDNCCWIIIVLILLFCCCGGNNGGCCQNIAKKDS